MMIHRVLRTVQAEHTMFNDSATIGTLVCTLAEETQTRWFLFLGEHSGRAEGALFEELMKIKTRETANWRTQK